MGTLSTHTDDECCAAPLSAALLSGDLDAATSWECPKCGQEWRAREFEGQDCSFKHWEPHCIILIM